MIDINSVMINTGQPVFENVQSNANVLTATYKSKPFKILAGTKTFIYDRKIYYTNSMIFNIDGIIYVPLKSFFENLGYSVNTQYDLKDVQKLSFYYYSKQFIYYVLQGEETYRYLNGIIYIRIKSSVSSKIVYLKVYDKISDDFLSKLKTTFLRSGLNLKLVSLSTITTKPTIVLKQGSENIFWINFLKKTNIEYDYYTKLGYDGNLSYSLVKDIGYNKLIICPTTMLNNTVVGFVYLFTTTSKINIDNLVRGINEFYKSN